MFIITHAGTCSNCVLDTRSRRSSVEVVRVACDSLTFVSKRNIHVFYAGTSPTRAFFHFPPLPCTLPDPGLREVRGAAPPHVSESKVFLLVVRPIESMF